MYACTYIYIYTNIHVHVCTFIHTYTYTCILYICIKYFIPQDPKYVSIIQPHTRSRSCNLLQQIRSHGRANCVHPQIHRMPCPRAHLEAKPKEQATQSLALRRIRGEGGRRGERGVERGAGEEEEEEVVEERGASPFAVHPGYIICATVGASFLSVL